MSELITEILWEEHVEKFFQKTVEEFKTALVDMESEWKFPFEFSAMMAPTCPLNVWKEGSEAMEEIVIALLALVDAEYRFTLVSVGAPGNIHDSTYFQSTDLWNGVEAGFVITDQVQVVNGLGFGIPPIILGDGGISVKNNKTWIAKPYRDAILSEEKRYFNYRGSRARMVTSKKLLVVLNVDSEYSMRNVKRTP